MTYVLGVSSGIFGAVRGAEPREMVEYAGISRKIHYAIYKGVKFNQVDVESITEFGEPKLKEHLDAIKRLGINFGFHGETRAFGAEVPDKFDSAIDDEYMRSHGRLITSIKKSGELGAEYYLLHSSETDPFLRLRFSLQPLMLVDVWGRFLDELLREYPEKLLDWVLKQDFIMVHIDYHFRNTRNRKLEEIAQKEGKTEKEKFTEEEWKAAGREALCEVIKSNEETYGAERVAYFIIAKWMEITDDPLWIKICGETVKKYEKETGGKIEKINGRYSIDDKKFREAENYQLWVPAVAAKYLWGHFNQDKCSEPLFDDPKKIMEEKEIYIVLESPMGSPGYERLNRLARPLHIHYLIEAISSKWVRVAWDFEHILSCDVNVDDEIGKLPEGGGELIMVTHLGWPSPIGPAHIPIPAGSEQQLILYTWLYALRKKGFKSGYLIFERGGGKDPIEKSIIVMRWIKSYLERDIPPDKLPDEFFGLPLSTIMAQQKVNIFMHAFDPLKGTLRVPEEEHTLLSTAAIRAGKKPEEWKKEESK